MNVLVCPSYDAPTLALSSWLTAVGKKLEADGIQSRLLHGELATRDNVLSELVRNADIFIFYGHGTDSTLLTQQGLGTPFDDRHDCLCDSEDLVDQRPICVIAYACRAALGIGRSISSKSKQFSFIGFRDDIPVILDDTYCENAFRKPMQNLICEVARRDGNLPRLRPGMLDF